MGDGLLREYSDHEWSVPWETIPEMLDAVGVRYRDQEAVADGETRLTYGSVLEGAQKVAAWLNHQGIVAGDRVALWADNTWEFVVAVCGIWYSGAVVVPLNTRLRGFEANDVLRMTSARALIAKQQNLITMLESVGGPPTDGQRFVGLPDLQVLAVLTSEPSGGTTTLAEILGFADTADDDSSVRTTSRVQPDSPCDNLYTSGSTGKPKGVVLTHRRNLQNAWDTAVAYGLDEGDRFLAVLPFSHGGGLNYNLMSCLMRGATIVPIAVFDPVKALELIQDESITIMLGPPTLYARILDEPSWPTHDLSSLRTAITGAASVPPSLIARLKHDLGLSRVANFYGLIEGGTISGTRDGDDLETVCTTSGRPLPGIEVRIIDEEGKDLKTGVAGEILVRHRCLMAGYLDPSMTPEVLDADGWLHTGDVGSFDQAGNLALVGRIKDVFIVGGFNAYPAEIEGLLLRHEEVRAAAVIGVPDPKLGDVGWAFVVPVENSSLSESALIAWAKEHMANYKVPRRILFEDVLPINATGKIDKLVLRARAEELSL